MSKRGRNRGAVAKDTAARTGDDQEAVETMAKTGWRRFPIWAWALIFIVPLALSEYMFYMAGRTASVVLFPIVWIGFWIMLAIRRRSPARSGD